MRVLLLPLLALLSPSESARADVAWSGSMHTRYRVFTYDDGLNSQTGGKSLSKQTLRAWDYRGNIFAKQAWEQLEFFAGLRLSNAIVNDFNTFASGGDGTARIDYAGAKYSWKATDDFSLIATVGRQATPFFYDKLAQHLFDTDVRWDGLNWDFKYRNFGFLMNQFLWGAKSQGVMGASSYSKTEASDNVAATQSAHSVVYGFEPYATLPLTEEINTTIAVAYYNWTNSENLTNTIHGGYNSSALNTNAATGTVSVNNAKVWHIYNQWNLPYQLHAVAEASFNKETHYTGNLVKADRSSRLYGIGYGGVKKAGDFAFDYYWNSKGLASMVGAINNGGIKPDNKGHLFYARYSPVDKVTLAVVAYFLREKAGRDAFGNASPISQKQQQWYFVAGAAF